MSSRVFLSPKTELFFVKTHIIHALAETTSEAYRAALISGASKNKYLTVALLHPIFNSLLAPATACELQATACEIEITPDMLWIGVNCIFKENIFSMYWSLSLLN